MDFKPEAVRVTMLGGFSIRVGSRIIGHNEWRLKRAADLIKLLALAPNHRLHREQVMEMLWSHLERRAASNNLRRTLHAARSALDQAAGSHYIASEEGWLVLCPEGVLWVDVEAFEEAVVTARREREPATYRAALELYAGEVLPGERYDDWAEGPRQELRQLNLALLMELANIYEERGEHEPAIEVLTSATTEEPAREEAHTALMRLYTRSGRQFEALKQYEVLEEALARELGTEPNASSRALRKEIAGATPSPLAGRTIPERNAAAVPGVGKHNLPAPRTSFVGREREVVEVKRALSMTRLLTLSGAGGSGKTRLAQEVARDLVGAYQDGVWLVDLAPLSADGLVPKVVAETLGTPEQPGRPMTDTLVESMHDKEQLLVMDNCEHLSEPTARLVDVLLDACPRLRVLATSRAYLGVAGELNWLVPSLSVPEGQTSTVEEVEGHESTRLFVARASYRRRDFSLTAGNARAVASICQGLDGMPLAIELAAARVGPLSVGQIAHRLDDSLMLLTGGSRMAVPRHRTLRATLDWSHELLSADEQKLFGRLSVFAGGWTLEAAEAVGAGEGLEEDDILDLLSRLVDKSLIISEGVGSSTSRYRMLEPVRQYASQGLKDSGQADETKRRHAEWCIAIAEEAEPELSGRRQGIWLERLEQEHDNLRSALSWSIGGEDAELGLRLAVALYMFWYTRGYLEEGREWLEKAISKNRDAATHARARALNSTGWMALFQGKLEEAMPLLEEGLALFRTLNDTGGIAAALYNLGVTLVACLEYERADALLAEAADLQRSLKDPASVARSLQALSLVALAQQRYGKATTVAEEGLTLSRESDDKVGIVLQDCSLALAQLGWGKLEQADVRCADALRTALGLKWKHGVAMSLQVSGAIAGSREQASRACRIWGAGEALRAEIGATLSPFEQSYYRPFIEAVRTRMDGGAFEEAWAVGEAMPLEEAVGYALSKEREPERPPTRSSGLTRREREVAFLVARGLTNRRVAQELTVSEHTVENHVAHILKKLNLHSREQIPSHHTQN